MRTASKFLVSLLAMLLTVTIGAVTATWIFAMDTATVTPTSTTLGMTAADYIGSISSLIEAIIEEMNTDGSDVMDNLEKRLTGDGNQFSAWGLGKYKYYGSMDPQKEQGGIAELLETYGSNYSFIVELINSNSGSLDGYTEAYIYTTDIYLGEAGTSTVNSTYANNATEGYPTIPIGENIYRIYRTKVQRANSSSDWEQVETYLGYAESAWYDENRTMTSQTSMIPSFDIDTWTAGTRGYSGNTAVRIYGSSEKEYSFTIYNDQYDENADLEVTDYNNGYGYYYLVLEVGGTSYDAEFDSYSNGVAAFLGYISGGNVGTDVYYTYSYTPEGNYTITCSLDDAEISVFTTDENTPIAEGIGSVTLDMSTAGTKYYLKINSSSKTASVAITYNS